MTEQELIKILALALYRIGEPLEISNQLLSSMMPVQIVVDPHEEQQYISISVKPATLLIGKIDDDVVEVLL